MKALLQLFRARVFQKQALRQVPRKSVQQQVLRQQARRKALRHQAPRQQARRKVPRHQAPRQQARRKVPRHQARRKVQRKARLLTRTAATRARTMWRFISTFTGICRAISSQKKKRKSSAGAAARLNLTRRKNVSAATVSGTMRACSRRKLDGATRSAISTRSGKKAAVQSGLCSQTTG